MVRKGLPKKYAAMGFKKGWAAYKRSKGGRKTTTSRSYTPKRRTSTMAKRKTKRRYFGRKKKGRSKSTLSISSMLMIILMLERMGILTEGFWNAIQAGSVGTAVSVIQGKLTSNFMGSGLPTTIAAFISVAVATYLVKAVAGGKGFDLKKPQRITV